MTQFADLTFDRFVGLMANVLERQHITAPNKVTEEDWQNIFSQTTSSLRNKKGSVPDPFMYGDWREYAREFFLTTPVSY